MSQLAKAVKGAGKGSKGKGNGKGHSEGGFSSTDTKKNVPNPLRRWWPCEVPDCKAYHMKYIGKPKYNKPSTDVCVECGRPRSATPALLQSQKEAAKEECSCAASRRHLSADVQACSKERARTVAQASFFAELVLIHNKSQQRVVDHPNCVKWILIHKQG